MSILRELIISIVLGAFMPRPKGTIADWVIKQQIIISGKDNQTYAGQILDPARTPCVSNLILGFLHPDEPNRELHFLKSSQSAASVTAIVAFGWKVQNMPGNCLYVIDTVAQVRDFSTERIDTLLRAIPHTSEELEGNEKGQRTLTKSFSNCALYLCGAQSASALTNKPISWFIGDEVERHPIINGTTTTGHGRARLTGSDESKLLQFSSPEIAARYEIDDRGHAKWIPEQGCVLHNEYLSGTQEKCHVPCPYCGHYQELVWENLKYSHCREQDTLIEGVPPTYNQQMLDNDVFILCENDSCRSTGPDCTIPTACNDAVWNHGKILEKFKPWMVAIGRHRWIPTPLHLRERKDIYPFPHHLRRSANLSSLYDIAFRSLRWGNLVREWLEAQADPSKLRFFLNHRLARPFAQQAHAALGESELAIHISTDPLYRRMHLDDTSKRLRHTRLPIAPHHVSLLADVQQTVIKWKLSCYSPEVIDPATGRHIRKAGEIFVLDWGVIPFDRDRAWHDALDDLTATIFYPPGDEHGGSIRTDLPCQCGIDIRHMPTEILSFCFERPWWQPISGDGDSTRIKGRPWWFNTVLIQDNKRAGKKIPGVGKEIDVLCLDVNHWERELMLHRLGQTDFENPKNSPRIHFPNDLKNYPAFQAEILNAKEEYVSVSQGRLKQLRWTKVHPGSPDDYHDTLKWTPLLWDVFQTHLTESQ